jgi:hypothetical protein
LIDRKQRAPDEGLLDDGDLAAPCAFTWDEDEVGCGAVTVSQSGPAPD